MKRVLLFGALAVFGTALWAVVAFEHGFAHGIGIDTQLSQEYGFFSGFGTFLLALVGYSGVFVTLVHTLNCHERGCWRLGKHKVNGTPWCTLHHENARPERSEHEVLESIEAKLTELLVVLKAQ